MAKILELARPAPALDRVLIKQADLQHGLRAARLLADARRRAKSLLSEAQQQAEDYRRQGYLQGYGAGVLAGAEAQVAALGDAWRLYQTHAASLQQALESQLESLLAQPELVIAMFEQWRLQEAADADCAVELHLPRRWLQARDALQRGLAAWPGARLHLHDGRNFVIKSGDHLYAYEPEQAAGELAPQILRQARQQDWSQACADIAAAALGKLHDLPASASAHPNKED
jgi:hypothetical protein